MGIDAIRPCVYGCIACSITSAALPVSTMRPAYITATRSASPATTARSCVIHIKAVPVSSHSLRIS
ncbi:Uncharacterised protein [Bordetella pertussis]|nr:Uncharacterised protein [Bordetella pertussis]